MAKSQETFSKKEKEKKRLKKRQEKEEKKAERKNHSNKGKSFEEMLAYVDENGNLSSTPPDARKRREISLESISIDVPRGGGANPVDLIREGVVTFFNDDKGYGFIKDVKTKESIFVHINSLDEAIKENDKLSFEVEQGIKGLQAVKVKLIK